MVKHTKRKGNYIVRKCISDFYLHKKWDIDRVEKGGKFVSRKDMFGLFDLVGISTCGKVHFIQVTSNRPHRHEDYKEFSYEYRNCPIEFIQYVWHSKAGRKRGWKIYKYDDGKVYTIDMRK